MAFCFLAIKGKAITVYTKFCINLSTKFKTSEILSYSFAILKKLSMFPTKTVQQTSIHGGEFAHKNCISGEVLRRADKIEREFRRMGNDIPSDRQYNLLFNNCEHFAYYCKVDDTKSVQVKVSNSLN